MPEFVISLDGQVVKEVNLPAGLYRLGRDPKSDIVLAHRTTSREHAVLRIDASGRTTIEDLGSANGTWVNGAQVQHQVFGPDDVVALGQYELRHGTPAAQPGQDTASQTAAHPYLLVQDGPSTGRKLALTKPVVKMGQPEVAVILLARRHDTFELAWLDGPVAPQVNGRALRQDDAVLLQPDDRITLGPMTLQYIAADGAAS